MKRKEKKKNWRRKKRKREKGQQRKKKRKEKTRKSETEKKREKKNRKKQKRWEKKKRKRKKRKIKKWNDSHLRRIGGEWPLFVRPNTQARSFGSGRHEQTKSRISKLSPFCELFHPLFHSKFWFKHKYFGCCSSLQLGRYELLGTSAIDLQLHH